MHRVRAFQVTNNTLDYMAKEEDFGKSIGKDLEEGKMMRNGPLAFAGMTWRVSRHDRSFPQFLSGGLFFILLRTEN